METTTFPYDRRLDMKPKGEAPPPCSVCGKPGPLTPMFTNTKPDLCPTHYDRAMNVLAKTLDK